MKKNETPLSSGRKCAEYSPHYVMAKYTKYSIWDVYLSMPNIVEWGIPEKILQNPVQSNRLILGQ